MLLWVNAQHHNRARQRTQQYRRLYLQLVTKLEGVTGRVNDMEMLLPYVTDHKVLDYYENCLRSLEGLLVAALKVPRFGADLTQLKTAHLLVSHCRDKVDRTMEAFRKVVKGKAPNYNKLFDWKTELVPPVLGCYFCSKPFRKDTFAKVRTKINGVTIEVAGCSVCREVLGHSKKVKVLYFMKNGQPVHWSQVPEYVPAENYWDLNKRAKVYATPRLELVRAGGDMPDDRR